MRSWLVAAPLLNIISFLHGVKSSIILSGDVTREEASSNTTSNATTQRAHALKTLQISCDGPLYGWDLSERSCIDILSVMEEDPVIRTFGPRGMGPWDFPLPQRLVSSKPLSSGAVSTIAEQASTRRWSLHLHHHSPDRCGRTRVQEDDLRRSRGAHAYMHIWCWGTHRGWYRYGNWYVCNILLQKNAKGLILSLGVTGRLNVEMRSYKPRIRCHELPESVRRPSGCSRICDGMSL